MHHQGKHSTNTPTVFEYNSVGAWTSRNPWNPNLVRRLPWLGLAAFLGALASAASSVALLVASDGKATSEWYIQPTVYLSISSTVTNLFLYLALSEGVNVAWWRRATREGTKLADLHRHWSYGNSFWAAFTSGRHLNLVALASVLVALGPINGPLLQRALQVNVGHSLQPSKVGIKIAQSLPDGYTGYLSAQGETQESLTTAFAQTVQAFDRQAAIILNGTGCKGKCAATVRGAGFAVDCSTSTTPFNLTPVDSQNGKVSNTSKVASINETLVFGSYLSWDASEPQTLRLGVQYKDQHACDRELQIRNCTLQATAVDYPVIIIENKSTIQLAPDSSIFNDIVQNAPEATSSTKTRPATLAGLYKALSDTYNSEANLRLLGAEGYELIATGATSNRYAVPDTSSPTAHRDCAIAFTDPSNDILAAVRGLMFRTAIAAGTSSDIQHVTAKETTTVPIYESNYLYLYIALGCTAVGWLAVIPLLVSYWHVGRAVSMSPVETAKAFGAPQLRSSDSNADSVKLLKEVGDRPVQYGATTVSGVEYRLEMNEPKYVRVPRAGERFAG